mgnify:CR=1 FL=1
MSSYARLIFAALIVSSTLVACGDKDAAAPTTSSVAETSAVATTEVETGMSEQAAATLLGAPTFSEISKLDDLTITHSEWTDEKGTTSVQFHNGNAVFSQFVAKSVED